MTFDVTAKKASAASGYSRDSLIAAAKRGDITSQFPGPPWIFNLVEVTAWAAGRAEREAQRLRARIGMKHSDETKRKISESERRAKNSDNVNVVS